VECIYNFGGKTMTKQELRNLWLKHAEEHKDLFEGRIKEDIEKYRKGDC
jgi:hypothetical protein